MIGIGECHRDSEAFASLYHPDFSLKMLQMLSGDCGGGVAQPSMKQRKAARDISPASLVLVNIAAHRAELAYAGQCDHAGNKDNKS